MGGAQGGGVLRPSSSNAAFFPPKGVACRGLVVLPSTPERGRLEGVSEPPEIGAAALQKAHSGSAAGDRLQLLLRALPLRLPLPPPLPHLPAPAGPTGPQPGRRALSLRRGRLGRTGHLPEPAGGARALESWTIPAPGARLAQRPAGYPAPQEGHQPRGADPSRECASPLPRALAASSLS